MLTKLNQSCDVVEIKTAHQAKDTLPVVNSYNGWDPLEEVIVGVIDYATIPQWDVMLASTMPEKHWHLFKDMGGDYFPKKQVEAAKHELENFVSILKSEGVTVRRPENNIDYKKPFNTLSWSSKGGLYAAMPRDILLVVGNKIIESPMSWRCRYFEINAYRKILKDYFHKGAIWSAAPKPELADELYRDDYYAPTGSDDMQYSITEYEPVFDAADFMRCGKDIFYQISNTTNEFGVKWLKQHLGDAYTFHRLEVRDKNPMHIDATFMPLGPGKVLVNREKLDVLPPMFKNWDVFYAPEPCIPDSFDLYMSSRWLSVNMFMLDESRIIVEADELNMIEKLKKWGFEPIPCSFRNFNRFGGSFHCATSDIRRHGTLKSYF